MADADPQIALERLNAASPAEFVAALGAIYEHSPWVAEGAAGLRPFASARALHDAMLRCVGAASDDAKLALVRAHPELAGKEATAGTLTAASSSEQRRLGLDRLDPAAFARLAELNRRYREKFGFPCIIALRLHPERAGVFAAFEQRLERRHAEELAAALDQIGEIARGRLATMLGLAAGRLTTHVLDTANGIPAAGMAYTLAIAERGQWRPLTAGETNAQGRTDHPLLADIDMAAARYRLEFHVGAYFRGRGVAGPEPAFLDVVPLEFGLAAPGQHYHVPLLCSPWSYATYRGS
ncbi:MAG: 2-oxo-4-hydroxy-4-carboxy-5-ureidoimidazoline decarboxylase [Rhodospirillaceae bacterium]|nr:2-oxo-4-hydroxy-4-carboxy-5-ureidoimidazoline decarboxylase [Rhodospirillaceae bacterium]